MSKKQVETTNAITNINGIFEQDKVFFLGANSENLELTRERKENSFIKLDGVTFLTNQVNDFDNRQIDVTNEEIIYFHIKNFKVLLSLYKRQDVKFNKGSLDNLLEGGKGYHGFRLLFGERESVRSSFLREDFCFKEMDVLVRKFGLLIKEDEMISFLKKSNNQRLSKYFLSSLFSDDDKIYFSREANQISFMKKDGYEHILKRELTQISLHLGQNISTENNFLTKDIFIDYKQLDWGNYSKLTRATEKTQYKVDFCYNHTPRIVLFHDKDISIENNFLINKHLTKSKILIVPKNGNRDSGEREFFSRSIFSHNVVMKIALILNKLANPEDNHLGLRLDGRTKEIIPYIYTYNVYYNKVNEMIKKENTIIVGDFKSYFKFITKDVLREMFKNDKRLKGYFSILDRLLDLMFSSKLGGSEEGLTISNHYEHFISSYVMSTLFREAKISTKKSLTFIDDFVVTSEDDYEALENNRYGFKLNESKKKLIKKEGEIKDAFKQLVFLPRVTSYELFDIKMYDDDIRYYEDGYRNKLHSISSMIVETSKVKTTKDVNVNEKSNLREYWEYKEAEFVLNDLAKLIDENNYFKGVESIDEIEDPLIFLQYLSIRGERVTDKEVNLLLDLVQGFPSHFSWIIGIIELYWILSSDFTLKLRYNKVIDELNQKFYFKDDKKHELYQRILLHKTYIEELIGETILSARKLEEGDNLVQRTKYFNDVSKTQVEYLVELLESGESAIIVT